MLTWMQNPSALSVAIVHAPDGRLEVSGGGLLLQLICQGMDLEPIQPE